MATGEVEDQENDVSPADYEDSLQRAGAALVLSTLRFTRELIVRRFEEISFLDHGTICRRTLLYLDLDAFPSFSDDEGRPWARYRDLIPIPLTTIERRQHRSHDVRGADGSLVPTLTRPEERDLVRAGVLWCLDALSTTPISQSSRDKITSLILGPPQSVQSVVADLALLPESHLFEDETIRSIVIDSATRYFLVALLDDDTCRPVLSITQNAPIRVGQDDDNRNWFQRAWDRMRYSGTVSVRFPVPSAGRVGSFHADIAAPYDLTFASARLDYKALVRDDWVPTVVMDGGRLEIKAHLHMAQPGTAKEISIVCQMRHRSTGLPRSSVLSAALTFAALLLGLFAIAFTPFPQDADSQSAAAMLLLAPAIVGAVLATPTTHSLTAKTLFFTRIWLAAISLTPLAAVATLVVPWNDGQSALVWGVSTVACGIGCIVLLLQWSRLRRKIVVSQ